MIIRESPSSKHSEPKTNWPPKSPHEALLTSPSRLRRQQQARRNDTSPTPSKRRRLDDVDVEEAAIDEVEEDEELLKLQLEEIAIRRKLKKIQDAKKKIVSRADKNDGAFEEHKNTVEIPHSPKQQQHLRQPPESPSRIQLGIDKGLKASDVSLRKARPVNTAVNKHAQSANSGPSKSFSERLAEIRTEDRKKDEKQRQREAMKSKGFDLSKSTLPDVSLTVSSKSDTTNTKHSANNIPKHVDRDQQHHSEGNLTTPIDNKHIETERHSGFSLSKRILDQAIVSKGLEGKTVVSIPQLLKDVHSPDYELPDFPTEDFVIMGIIASKSLPRDHQKSADDFSKPAQAKFMAITLTDLQWSVDLYLFASGFERFWKLTVGTIIAILNPGIMPPKPHLRDTGRFSLKLSSSEDTVLEIGMSQDLGFCSSVKRDGKQCGQWVDKRKTEFCDFHVNLAIEKTTSKRMEINGMSSMGLFDMGNPSARRGGRGRGMGPFQSRGGRGGRDASKLDRKHYDRHLGETAYIVPPAFGTTTTTAKLLDAEDYVRGGMSSKELSRKRLADREKERELSQKLAGMGKGMGGEYMRIRSNAGADLVNRSKEDGDTGQADEPKSAADFGLVGASAAAVTLSPVKGGGRRGDGLATQPMGWSGAFKRGLLSPSRKQARSRPSSDAVHHPDDNASNAVNEQVVSATRPSLSVEKATATVSDDDDGLDII